MEIKKYEFTEETLEHNGHILHRIKSLRDFGNIKAGQLGGWIEKEENLSHEDTCWAYQNAKVYDNAVVKDNAKVFGEAMVFGYANIGGNAMVFGEAMVFGYANIGGNAMVCGGADVCGDAMIVGGAVIRETKDYAVFKNTWSSGRFFTWTRSNNMWRVGCFYGTGEALIAKAYKDSELSGKCYEAIVQAQNRISELLK